MRGRPHIGPPEAGAVLEGEDFARVDWWGAELDGVTFTRCRFDDAGLEELVTRRCVFDHCVLTGVRMGGARHVGSAFLSCRFDRATVGVGMGQVNRVDAARLAVTRAGERAAGAVAASDAFFPFADGLQVLLEAGVRAVVQPGGSVRDEEVISAAVAAGVPLYLTGTRHFAH